VTALEAHVDAVDVDGGTLATYRHYYLTLKKDLRLFEEAVDEIKYGGEHLQTDASPQKRDTHADADKDVDFLGSAGEEDTPDAGQKEEDAGNLLDLTLQVADVDLLGDDANAPLHTPEQTPPLPQQVPEPPLRGEAFDFLSEKPSEW